MLFISKKIFVPLSEIEITAIRAHGPGGQHVNKVSSAIQLRFDILRSSLPKKYKTRLLQLNDRRITAEGIIIINAKRFKSQHKNKADALSRLGQLIKSVVTETKQRIPTQPTAISREKRLKSKAQRGQLKVQRQKIKDTGDAADLNRKNQQEN